MSKSSVCLLADIEQQLRDELKRACRLHPVWPSDLIHRVGFMVEEAGETLRAALNAVHHGGSIEEVRKEAVQTGAMCLRLLINLENHE